jgi:DNA replication protein DnaC
MRILPLEIEGRQRTAHHHRLKRARLPLRTTLEAFDVSFHSTLSERRMWDVAERSFVATHTTIVFLGSPGVGKTHLAIALAVTTLEAGHSVFFTTLTDVIEDLDQASAHESVKARLCRSTTPAVLVSDESGSTTLSAQQANWLFELVRTRDEHGSTMVTSNTSVAEWGKLMNDEVLATALLDRLLHHAEVVTMNGTSSRMKDRQAARIGKGGKSSAGEAAETVEAGWVLFDLAKWVKSHTLSPLRWPCVGMCVSSTSLRFMRCMCVISNGISSLRSVSLLKASFMP